MVRNFKKLHDFEKQLIRETRPDYRKNLAIFEALYKEYLKLNKGRKTDPLEGIELKIKLARIINSV